MPSTADLSKELRTAVERAGLGEIVVSIHLFGIKYAHELENVSLAEVVEVAGLHRSYVTEIRKGMRLADYVRLK